MSEPLFPGDDQPQEAAEDRPAPGARRGKRRRGRGCLPVLLVLVVFAVAGWWAVNAGIDQVRERFSGPEDYSGADASGEVVFTVESGQSVASMGSALAELDVVASSEAFVDAARARSDETRGIQVGSYLMQEKMTADDAVGVLVDPANVVQTMVTIPEGLRVSAIVERLGKETEFSQQRFQKLLDNPERIGLPEQAGGNPEGYLFPATYAVSPTDTPRTILTAMVERWQQAASDADLEARAEELGYSPHEIMTIASLIEAEAPPEYMTRVSRVIYNRIERTDQGTNGLLQLDATVNYAHGDGLGARTTAEDREIDSPYNTYKNTGLPPGPIESPGDEAIKAAVEPADGDWFYYVTVNLDTGETKFAETLSEHNGNVDELNQYCRDESERC
ncbi:endolytic transglycosylase MltG [Nocardioides panacisoli]|uniref:endolytic transglycosylase MltG n=1 Tax=Nocardioides panacisoli TaxID=627624 RepID=UPI001C62BE12|nr:endolytic transglycosylase MltG [Nocardioides panacisoli]QYJ05205.1 endolytic transglycosylase MltG [Nocardioides panacisoli]